MRSRLLETALPCALFVVWFVLYPCTGHDDKYITYWVIDHLARTGEMVNYNGERVEQSVPLLQILLLGAARALTRLPVAILAMALSILSGIAAVLLAGRIAGAIDARASGAARWLTACYPPLVLWSFSGMEITFACAIYAAAVVAMRSYLAGGPAARAIAALAAVTLVRPESTLVWFAALGFAAVLVWKERAPRNRLLVLAGATLVLGLAVAAFRLGYFGRLVPQPVISKSVGYADIALSFAALLRPDMYSIGVLAIAPTALILGLHALGRRSIFPTLLGALLLSQLGYAFAIGEDVFLGARFYVPFGPLLCAWAAVLIADQTQARRAISALCLLQAACSVQFARSRAPSIPMFTSFQFLDPSTQAAVDQGTWLERHNRPHTRDLAILPIVLAAARDVISRKGSVVVASGQAGFVTSRLADELGDKMRFVDREGIATREWEQCHRDWRDCGPPADIEFGFFEEPPAGMRLVAEPRLDNRLAGDWLGKGPLGFPVQRLAVRSE